MTISTTGRPLPIVTDENAPYWRSARNHALELPFCLACARAYYPPQHRCPACLGERVEWRPVRGRGHVVTWTVMHQIYDPWFTERVPYVTAVVEIVEGPRLVATIVHCAPDAVRLDMPVRAVYEDVDDDLALVCFEPEEDT
jgi:uncharacterized OB-fold protein